LDEAEKELRAACDRTDAKLRYAAVHLEELQATERRGSDFDRSHQEAFLFQLSGVRDAFFQECNLRHDCGLDPEKVRRNSLEEKLRASGKEAPSLKHLAEVEARLGGWFSQMQAMRHHSTHLTSVPRKFHVGGPSDGLVFLQDPKTGAVVEEDYVVVFRKWLDEMRQLIVRLRELDRPQETR
jgi:hypothetical protein